MTLVSPALGAVTLSPQQRGLMLPMLPAARQAAPAVRRWDSGHWWEEELQKTASPWGWGCLLVQFVMGMSAHKGMIIPVEVNMMSYTRMRVWVFQKQFLHSF